MTKVGVRPAEEENAAELAAVTQLEQPATLPRNTWGMYVYLHLLEFQMTEVQEPPMRFFTHGSIRIAATPSS